MIEPITTTDPPRAVLDRIDAALDAWPFLRRARFWVRLLSRATPQGASGWLAYAASAAIDSWGYSTAPDAHPVPLVRYGLTLRLREPRASLMVRQGTDDIIHALPGREQDVHRAILEPLRPGDTFVDVGANIGYYTVLGALRVGPRGRVVAVEPITSTNAILRKNVRLNALENVAAVEGAAGAECHRGARIFFDPHHMGRASLREESRSQVQNVPMTTLDRICEKLEEIRLLKIDVEGSELAVLRGAVRTLKRTERVVVECNEDGAAIDRFLENQGFEVRPLRFTNHREARRDRASVCREG